MDQSDLQVEFYNKPLCISGYLTPLQRKKLREKRKFDPCSLADDTVFTQLKKVKKTEKGRSRLKKKSVSPKQCTVPKPLTESNVDNSTKKFFKSVSPRQYFVSRPLPDPKVCNSSRKFFKSSHSRKASFSLPIPLPSNFMKFIGTGKLPQKSDTVGKENKIIVENNHNHVETDTISSASDGSDQRNHSAIIIKLPSSNEAKHLENYDMFDFDWPSEDVLLKRQEKARSHQKVTSITKSDTLKQQDKARPHQKETLVSESDSSLASKTPENPSPKKLYPIFEKRWNREFETCPPVRRESGSSSKSFKTSPSSDNQLIIDAGQSEIGPVVCKTCGMLYNKGHEEDEKLHSRYHSMFLINLKFPGWKNEDVIGEYADGRVIKITKEDQGFKLKKVEDVLVIVNKDLGSPNSLPPKPDLVFVLFVSNEKCVMGCLVAEPITSAFKIVFGSTNNHSLPGSQNPEIGRCYLTTESFPAVCGINRIWVSKNSRRCKIASRMLDCLRCHFIHGHVVEKQEIAFLDPAVDGRKLATSYLGTESFLVYR